MEMSSIRTTEEIPVRKKVLAAFKNKLSRDLSLFDDPKELKYIRSILDDTEKHIPERWKTDTKKEFVYFLEACAEIYADNTQK